MTPSPAQPPSTHAPALPGPALATGRRADDNSEAAAGFAILLAGLLPASAQAAGTPALRPSADVDAAADGPPDVGATAPIAAVAPASDQGAASPLPAGPAGKPAVAAGPAPAAPFPGLPPATPLADSPPAAPAPANLPPMAGPQPQPAAPDPRGGDGTPQGGPPEGTAAAAALARSTTSFTPAAAQERAGPQPAVAAASDPLLFQAAVRAPDQAGRAIETGAPDAEAAVSAVRAVITAPVRAEPPAGTPAPALPPAPEAAAFSPASDAEPAPTRAKADAPTAAASAPTSRPAPAPAPESPPATDARSALPADLGAAAPVRSEPIPSAPITAPQHPSTPAPPVSVGVQLGVQIAAAVPHRIERLLVQLEPPALGRVEVRLEFSRDNRVSAVIAADRHDTLDVLQRDSGALQRALQDAGLRLNDNGLSFSLRQDQRQPERGAGAPDPLRLEPAAGPDDKAAPLAEAGPVSWFGVQRVLDIRI